LQSIQIGKGNQDVAMYQAHCSKAPPLQAAHEEWIYMYQYTIGTDQITDIFTKVLPCDAFQYLRYHLSSW
jgi:hypothetical protein